MKTKLLKKVRKLHPIVEVHNMFVVKYNIHRIGYNTRQEAITTLQQYIKKRYGKDTTRKLLQN